MSPPLRTELASLAAFRRTQHELRHAVVHGVDFRGADVDWDALDVTETVFLGCLFSDTRRVGALVEAGAIVFPRLPALPYRPYRTELYTWRGLMEGWSAEHDESVDKQIYDHFVSRGRHQPDIVEALAQRIHDHAIDEALRDRVANERVVGIMGGHGELRGSEVFRCAARVARDLARAGYFVASGGGPGVMEAANLGAWLAKSDDDALNAAIDTLAQSPAYTDAGYVDRAMEVVARHPTGTDSLAVPTWFYGHEPSNLFGTHIAKYFSNSIREDALLAVCLHGIVFAPGSAGTTQEIFQDAAQNHYATFGHVSPMVFMGTQRYCEQTQLYDTVRALAAGREYADMITVTDSPSEAVAWIQQHPPIFVG